MNMLNGANQKYIGDATEIGGYFGLDLPDYGDLYPDAYKYQSGRAAIRAVLECAGIKRVILPAYVCDSVIQAVVDSGASVETYGLDESLYPIGLPRTLPNQSAFLYVNYFGLCQKNVTNLLGDIPCDRLIIDNSQALFASRANALAAVYSPRKFAGVPDGGLLAVSPSLEITPPKEMDNGSIERMRYMLLRAAYSAREGYADFQKAAASLKDTQPLAMSGLTRRLIKSIPWDQVAKRRRENFQALANLLDDTNDMHWSLDEMDVPLCYPLMLRGCEINRVKTELDALNIFVPTYWQDASPRIAAGSIEAALINETLFLPIDQRLDRAQVMEMASLISGLVAGR
jgi:hypothetical protein